jgi:outer membrane lipoprotein-sorting protein
MFISERPVHIHVEVQVHVHGDNAVIRFGARSGGFFRMLTKLGLFACAGLAVAGALAQDLTLDRIIKANENALGGAETIASVQTLKTTARITAARGGAGSLLITWTKRPNFARSESDVQGRRVIAGFDGKTAWIIKSAAESSAAEILDARTAAGLADANIDTAIGSLAGIKAAGAAVELLGQEDFGGLPVYRLQVTRKSDMVAVYLIDAATYLPVKTITKGFRQGLETEVEAFLGDYRKRGNILFAHSIEQRVGGQVIGRVTYEKIEINEPMDDGIFKMPGSAAPAVKK